MTMHSLSFALIARIARRAALLGGVAATATIVACSDDATAPRPASVSVPTGVDATILPLRSLVTVRVTLWNGTLFAYDKASVKFFINGDSGVVKDNSALDKDTTTGIITANLARSATVKVCLTAPPKDWGFSANAACNTVAGGTPTVNAGSLIIHGVPAVQLNMRNKAGNIIAGGQFVITGPPGSGYSLTITDEDANDLYKTPGKIVAWVPAPGTYKWCEKTPPPGYNMASPQCGFVDLIWDFGITVDITHSLKLYGLPF
jgi:hypothetical protein